MKSISDCINVRKIFKFKYPTVRYILTKKISKYVESYTNKVNKFKIKGDNIRMCLLLEKYLFKELEGQRKNQSKRFALFEKNILTSTIICK